MMIMTTEGMTFMTDLLESNKSDVSKLANYGSNQSDNYSRNEIAVRKLVQQTVAEKDLATVRSNLSALVHLLDSTNSKTGACSLLLAIAEIIDDEINTIELRDMFGVVDRIDYPEDDLIFEYGELSEPVAILR